MGGFSSNEYQDQAQPIENQPEQEQKEGDTIEEYR